MADVQALLKELGDVSAHPGKLLRQYRKQGRKVAGCMPVYVPAELAYASGMLPMGLWGGQVTPMLAGKYNPVYTCSIMRSCLELGMNGTYDGLSCILMPMLCDTLRGMSAAWRAGVKDIPLIPFIHPQNREDSGALEFLISEYGAVRSMLERYGDREITDEAITASIEVYNRHSEAMRDFALAASDHLDIITPVIRHHVFRSAMFMDRAEHTEKVRGVIERLAELPAHHWTGHRVLLTGITGEPASLLMLMARNSIAVVGDDLAQESRQYRTPIPEGTDPLERLAGQWLHRAGCSTVHEKNSSRASLLVKMARETGADGIVICLMRFCDVEEYEYPMLAKAASEAGLRCLCLEIDQSTQDNGQSATKLQSFAEMLA